ncbi:MAG: transposase [Polynucleobacter sp.]|nr:transposase [Polynucleobacter sp.]
MARLARFVISGHAMHVMVLGHNRETIFPQDEDRRVYLDWLRIAAKDFACQVHAFALLPNYAHLLLTPSKEESLARTMQSLGRRYAQYFNRQHRHTGTIWEGRFRSSLIDPQFFLQCQRFIELTPVRVGLESKPEDFRWTSYRDHIGGKGEGWLNDHPQFWALGNTPFERQLAWLNYVKEGVAPSEEKAITEHIARSRPWLSPEFAASLFKNNPKLPLLSQVIRPRGRPKKL